MKWSDKLSVGNDKIDNQHRKLIETLDDHLNACTQRKGKEEITNTLNFLAKYVVIHFRDEEKYLLDNGYPKLKQHQAIHNQFLKEVTDIINKVNSEGVSLTVIIDVNKKLNDWVYDHIMQMDKEYYNYFNSL